MFRAASINDADQVVGSSGYYWVYGGYGHSSAHACRYAGGVFTDLGSLTGDPRTNTEAYGINNAGQIVGYSTASDGLSHAFLYSAGAMQDLGTLGSASATAIAINDHALIIGTLTGPYGAALGSFVVANGTMSDLSGLIVQGGDGWSQLTVTGLNNGGTIVGYGLLNGLTHGFVATPTQAAGVPPARVDLATGIAAPAPNPFHSATEIAISLSQRAASGNVRLEIFDAAGRRVAALLDQRLEPGRHSVAWNGRADGGAAIGSGIYFARLTTLDGSASRRLVLER
jgi:probable HAF family extracellular repeat protein